MDFSHKLFRKTRCIPYLTCSKCLHLVPSACSGKIPTPRQSGQPRGRVLYRDNYPKVFIIARHMDKETCVLLRDWSLIMGRGGYKTRGGQVKFYPYEMGGGAGKVLAMLKGEAQQVLG